MDTTYRKNLKAVLTASKNYTDNSIEKLKWELGTYDLSITTDSTVAYTKTIPANAIKGRLNYIGGASKVSKNLIVLNDVAETTENGTTYKIENGIIYLISGTAIINKNKQATTLTLPAGTYYFKSFGTTGSNSTYFSYIQAPIEGGTLIRYSYDNKSFTLNVETEVQYIWAVRGGVSVSNLQFKDMLVSGTTAPTEFSVGFENIRSAKTTSVKFEGANLSPYANVANNQVLTTLSAGTYTISFNVSTTSGGVNLRKNTENGEIITTIYINSTYHKATFTLQEETVVFFNAYSGGWTNYNIMINRGSTALDYKPYIAPITKAIPSEIQALEDYGLGLDDTTYNYIDLINKNFIQKGHKIVVDENTGYTWISSALKNATIRTTAPYKAPTTTFKAKWYGNDNILNIGFESGGHLYITFTNAYASETELKNAMLGVVIEYELATPIETDISQYIDDDFKNIDTTNMTTATFENEFGYDVPSEIDYLIEEVKA